MEDAGRGRIIGSTYARTHFTVGGESVGDDDDLPLVEGIFRVTSSVRELLHADLTCLGNCYYTIARTIIWYND